jgi:transcriptional regulator with XRE-family HTH domain
METLGTRLRKRRKELDLTQEELSNKISINRVTYQGYESDRHKPDVDTLSKLADILHTSTDYLLGRY